MRDRTFLIKTTLILACMSLCRLSLAASESALYVYGWDGTSDLHRSDRPDEWLGDDAVVGRQVCPALVRYNVSIQKSEPVLLKALPEVSEKDGVKWSFSLRPGLRWWNGAGVSSSDLADFLRDEISSQLKKSSYLETFRIELKPTAVEVHWLAPPKFGPYFLSGRPFWRAVAKQNPAFECAGLYKITDMTPKKNLTLTLAPGYSGPFKQIRFLPNATTKAEPYVSFELAEDRSSHKDKIVCQAKLDLPVVTAIIWNPKGPFTSTPKLRQALTHAVPRGEILRTAGGDLGALISAPMLRTHPGYMGGLVVRPYSPQSADHILSESGFSQASVGIPRKAGDGKIMRLKIGLAEGQKQELIEKIITDSFASIGIEVDFVQKASTKDTSMLDGILMGIALPWPSSDLKETFVSNNVADQQSFPFFSTDDKPLDDLLTQYGESFSIGRPRFDLLGKIHGRFMDIEPWTTIMSHQACVASRGINLKGKIQLSDPDWFRRQVVE